ncbi:MAG: Uma2 family endonuclease [Oscillatoriales cyanobacterium]|uniref:Uma2 family endonuclease n=1 Tax=Microcoleus anatoxicus PTRS2 TaxID=2705321 RepID=A0ABU8YHF8_9CYAN|nr:MAG: Uma2 family endonuclease [Oscillatoriales cyanobacterium]TAE01822.1 MAG: Uma2 family endonuclease [Oscillatoriales cyanobacterium]TAE97885.1 MAG: Uma2 family endonuclease [Oscillatoriales cyanobacterium]
MVITQTNPPNLTDATKTRFSLDEYRAIEETAQERHEYCNGEIIAMSGGSEVHSAIACNLLIYLGFLLRDTDFRLYNSDLRVWIPEHRCGTYTDLMVVNGEPELNGDRTDEILNPLLIVEVLSPSTEACDRGEKFRKYRSIASFCEYLLVSQTEPYIEQYHNLDRQSSDRWQLQVYDGIDRAIVLHSLNIELPMAEVYRRISL